jgi:hypothetical protein
MRHEFNLVLCLGEERALFCMRLPFEIVDGSAGEEKNRARASVIG